MCVIRHRKGGMITFLSLIFMILAVVWIGAMFSVSSSKRKYSENLGKAEQAAFLAEKGIALAYTELKYHGFDWATHVKEADGSLKKNPKIELTPTLKKLYVEGAKWDNGDYLPTGDSNLRVRTYLDDTLNIWIVAKAEVDGVVRVARMRLESGSLYDYFLFVPGDLRLKGENYFDAQGVGKIYVGGDVICDTNKTTFKDVVEFSTNKYGHIRASWWGKWPPCKLDTLYDQGLDGYALLSSKKGELGRTDYAYPADDPKEALWDPNSIVCTPGYVFRRPQDPSRWKYHRPPVFVFTKDKMESRIKGWENYDPDVTQVSVQIPLGIYDNSGEPIKRDCDLYTGPDHTSEELPVKFVRFYYQDEDGRWRITSDPDKHEGVVAQVFDGKDTAESMDHIDYKVNEKVYHIPVKEDGIEYKWIDKNGNENTVDFDVEYEKNWWGTYLYDERGYVQDGYTRKDGDPAWGGYPEHTWTNILDTGNAGHLERLKDWMEGNYKYDEGYYGDADEDHKLTLNDAIKIGGLGAETQDPPEINVTFDTAAKTEGIWVGYEETIDLPEWLINFFGGPENVPSLIKTYFLKSTFTVYVNGEKVYSEGGTAPFPEWLKMEEFYTGNDKQHKNGIKAKVLTIDIKKMQEELGEKLDETNGVVWVNYRNPKQDINHNYSKAVRLVNGEVLPRDLTFVTPQSVMIQGDFNCKDESGTPDDTEWKPASIITDGDVYLLSEGFTPPKEVPAYKVPRFPDDDEVKGFSGTYDYEVRQVVRWREYLLERLDSDSFPSPEDDEATRKEKVEKVKKVIKEFYDSTSDKKYGGVDVDKIDFDSVSWKDWYSIVGAIVSGFYKTHDPDNPSPGYAGAMPVVGEDLDNKHTYVYASIVRSVASNQAIGTRLYYLENWKWPEEDFSWGSCDDPPDDVRVVLRGMFPRVRGSEEEVAEKDRWSDDYSEYIFASGANWTGAFVTGWLNGCPAPEYYAQEYNNDYPPGSALVAAVKAYYISSDPADFDHHPEKI